MALMATIANASCGMDSPWLSGDNSFHNITITDPNFGKVPRQFIISMPENYNPEKKYPLFFYFHGQGGHGIANQHYINQQKEDYIVVYPQGMGDFLSNGNPFYSWNVPLKYDDMNVCTESTGTMCYDSCRNLGKCYTCSWCTCYDDLLFVKQLVAHVKSKLCIDDEKVLSVGVSNGGMWTYYLSQAAPEIFRAFIIESAQPLKGYLGAPQNLKGAQLLLMNGRQDNVFPPEGGVDKQNEWITESQASIMNDWGKVQDCDIGSFEKIETPFDHSEQQPYKKGYNLSCSEYKKGCSGRTMNCAYYGTHADGVAYDADLVKWFLPWFENKDDDKIELIQ